MKYKETLLFIAKSLTITLEEKNRAEIKSILKSSDVDWDVFVKLSTSHNVFTTIYLNFKRANFLRYLPDDLVDYMKYITNLNKSRNLQILKQVKELNNLLLANNITPIFLKGVSNLWAGIYQNVSERTIGDIDFIFSNEDYPKAITVLRDYGYSDVEKRKYYDPETRHHRRLQKKNHIAAIEIHKELIIEDYTSEFNFNLIKKDIQIIKGVCILSYANKLNLSIISFQINDNGFYYKTMSLRNAYDVFLLSKKTNAKVAVTLYDKLTNPLNCFLAACYEVFNKIDSLEYNYNKKTESYLRALNKNYTNRNKAKIQYKIIKTYLSFKSKLIILQKSLIYKEYRFWLFNILTDITWYGEKLSKLGIMGKIRKKQKL